MTIKKQQSLSLARTQSGARRTRKPRRCTYTISYFHRRRAYLKPAGRGHPFTLGVAAQSAIMRTRIRGDAVVGFIFFGTYFIYTCFLFVAASLKARRGTSLERGWTHRQLKHAQAARATADWNRSFRVSPFARMTTVRTAEKRRLEGNRIRNPFPWNCLRASAVGEKRATFWQKAGAMIEVQHGARFVLSIEHRFNLRLRRFNRASFQPSLKRFADFSYLNGE